jgi:hypothetical protein
MEDQSIIYQIIDNYIQQKGYEIITPKPDVSAADDWIFCYRRTDPPRKTISAVWNTDRGYFMIQQVYRRKIDPAQFLIRFKDLKDNEELQNDMEMIFKEWNEQ